MRQQTNVMSNNGGYSLIEVLIAMAILAIVAVALMKSSLLVIQKNSQNEIRDEAVRLAEQTMNSIRSGPGGFDNAAAGNLDLVPGNAVSLPAVTRTIRGGSITYSMTKDVVNLETTTVVNTKQVTVTVSWPFRGQTFTHSIMSIVRR
jgi:prepilin-type N-terminal cleavage/methylation domain-containing protein